MSTPLAMEFDTWIRSQFRDINTELEHLYFAQSRKEQVQGIGETLKQTLAQQGLDYIQRLTQEGNTDEGFESGFDLLGNVGFFLAACRRHEIKEVTVQGSPQDPFQMASALAMQLGASLGVVPRFASAHLETHNRAKAGVYKSFTHLEDEKCFIEYNTRGVFAFIRASEALLHTLPLGISHPVTYDLLNNAQSALQDVVTNNKALFTELHAERFFYSVRPYYKPYQVGRHEYRGANAGDFAGINVIDLLLGLCRGDDPYYSQLLVDKFLFMRPEEQLTLRDCMRQQSLLDSFLAVPEEQQQSHWYQRNLEAFLQVCTAHGDTARQHHEQLIKRFIEIPAHNNDIEDKQDLTASGPPLPVLLRALKKLHDLRTATEREDIPTRYADIQTLKERLRPTSNNG